MGIIVDGTSIQSDFPKKIKADLLQYGPIGFTKLWLDMQGFSKTNLLKEMTDRCIAKDIDVCAITSCYDEIPKQTAHDRFGCMKDIYSLHSVHEIEKHQETLKHMHNSKNLASLVLPSNYQTDTLGENILIVNKDGHQVYFVNSQVIVGDIGDETNFQHLAIGSNQVPNHKLIVETMTYLKEHDLISVVYNPFGVGAGRGIGDSTLEVIAKHKLIDAIDGHSSERSLQNFFGKVPILRSSTREMNRLSQEFADRHKIPWIAVSGRIENIGSSYIEFDSKLLNNSSGERFLQSLNTIIKENSFSKHCKYKSFLSTIKGFYNFKKGVSSGQDVPEEIKYNPHK